MTDNTATLEEVQLYIAAVYRAMHRLNGIDELEISGKLLDNILKLLERAQISLLSMSLHLRDNPKGAHAHALELPKVVQEMLCVAKHVGGVSNAEEAKIRMQRRPKGETKNEQRFNSALAALIQDCGIIEQQMLGE